MLAIAFGFAAIVFLAMNVHAFSKYRSGGELWPVLMTGSFMLLTGIASYFSMSTSTQHIVLYTLFGLAAILGLSAVAISQANARN